MATDGVVRLWLAEHGWGVIDTTETPGGCWAHFSMIRDMPGHRALRAGDRVRLEWEAADQDGYDHRAVWVERVEETPGIPTPAPADRPFGAG